MADIDPSDFPCAIAPPEPEPAIDFDRVVASVSFQRDNAISAMAQTKRNVSRAIALEEARRQMVQLEKENHRALAGGLRELARSPLISKDTHAAFFKSIIVEYLAAQDSGDTEGAPSLRDVLTAAKMLSDTCGLNAPTEVKSTHDINLKVFPVSMETFKGELPELEVKDVQINQL